VLAVSLLTEVLVNFASSHGYDRKKLEALGHRDTGTGMVKGFSHV
jgi:hypothetical protein